MIQKTKTPVYILLLFGCLFFSNSFSQKIDSVEYKKLVELSKELIKANGNYKNWNNDKDAVVEGEINTMRQMQLHLSQKGLVLKTNDLKSEHSKALGNMLCAKISAFNAASLIKINPKEDKDIDKYLQDANDYIDAVKFFLEKNDETIIAFGSTEIIISKETVGEVTKLINSVSALKKPKKEEAEVNYDEKRNDGYIQDMVALFATAKKYLDDVDEKKVSFDSTKTAKFRVNAILLSNVLNSKDKYKGFSSYYAALVFYACALLEYELGTKEKAFKNIENMQRSYSLFKDELAKKREIKITIDGSNYELKSEQIAALDAAVKSATETIK